NLDAKPCRNTLLQGKVMRQIVGWRKRSSWRRRRRRDMTMQRIRDHYGVPARRGMRVTVDGRPGVITSAERGGTLRLRVRLDGERRPVIAHPSWRVTYLPCVMCGVGDERCRMLPPPMIKCCPDCKHTPTARR